MQNEWKFIEILQSFSKKKTKKLGQKLCIERTCLEAFEFDELLHPVNNENLVVVIYETYVTRVKPTLNIYGGCCGLVVIQISWICLWNIRQLI